MLCIFRASLSSTRYKTDTEIWDEEDNQVETFACHWKHMDNWSANFLLKTTKEDVARKEHGFLQALAGYIYYNLASPNCECIPNHPSGTCCVTFWVEPLEPSPIVRLFHHKTQSHTAVIFTTFFLLSLLILWMLIGILYQLIRYKKF